MTGSKRNIGSDLAKVDAYRNTVADYEELPELKDEFFARAAKSEGIGPARGQPSVDDQVQNHVMLRLDQDVLDHFRSKGEGWQRAVNAYLRKALG